MLSPSLESFRTVREHGSKLCLCLPGQGVGIWISRTPFSSSHGSSSLPSFPLPFSSSFLLYSRFKKKISVCFLYVWSWWECFSPCVGGCNSGWSLRFSCTSCSLKSRFVKNAGNVSGEARRLKSQPLFPVSLPQKGEGVGSLKEYPIVILETGLRKPPQRPEETGFSAYQKLKWPANSPLLNVRRRDIHRLALNGICASAICCWRKQKQVK